jgi:hypothetical protein
MTTNHTQGYHYRAYRIRLGTGEVREAIEEEVLAPDMKQATAKAWARSAKFLRPSHRTEGISMQMIERRGRSS